jgi:hypothetical protein
MSECQLDTPPFHQCCCQCKLQGEIVTNQHSQHIGHVCMLRHELQSRINE